jgi:hypothetical protein
MAMQPYTYREHILVEFPDSGTTLVHTDINGKPGQFLYQAKNLNDAKAWVDQVIV